MTEFDDQFMGKLLELINNTQELQHTLMEKRPSCVCNGLNLCSHHQIVWTHMDKAMDELLSAIERLTGARPKYTKGKRQV